MQAQAPAKPAAAPTISPNAPGTAPRTPSIATKPSARADVPPAEGYALLVDGHFKNQFDSLTDAKAAATDLKSRFPILRIEIYDAAKKTRLPI
jgi:hypothetical protein